MLAAKRKIAFYTLGCKLNFSETSTLARKFLENGFERVPHTKEADVYVINTCSVTEHADKKCRQAIRKFIKLSPQAVIVATGCYAQLKPDEIAAMGGVDLVLGADQKGNLFEYVNNLHKTDTPRVFSCEINQVNSFFPAFSSGDRTRSFLKVQDGCNYHCSYCTIPLARGKSRNIGITDILKEAETIASQGIKEVVLTGVNIGDFGRTTGESFFDLVKALDRVDGIERYRISSIEPNLLTDEIIEFTARSAKFLPHFHIPLQSGCDKILKLMRRRYTTKQFADRIAKVREYMPDAFIGIDVIVGFPGETDDDFNQTLEFLKSVNPAFLHIFPYSERANTPTVTMEGKVKPADITQRVHALGDLCTVLHTGFYKSQLGKTAKVLFESTRREGNMFGYTDNYIKVETPYNKELIGNIAEVRLDAINKSGNVTVSLL